MYLDKRKMWVVAEWGGVAVVVVGGVGGGGVGGPMRKRALLRAAGQGHFLPHRLYSEHFVQGFVLLAHNTHWSVVD